MRKAHSLQRQMLTETAGAAVSNSSNQTYFISILLHVFEIFHYLCIQIKATYS